MLIDQTSGELLSEWAVVWGSRFSASLRSNGSAQRRGDLSVFIAR